VKIGPIDVEPIAAESMGVRSLCTRIQTPDVRLLLDPSAALSRRNGKEPHPLEYIRLKQSLERIFTEARAADIISVSHYHYDHIRPGFTDFRYTFGSREELQRMFHEKTILAKDYRDHINASQRRRGYYFERDLKGIAKEIVWADGLTLEFGFTEITFSGPLPHGPENTPLGYVVATTVRHANECVMFVPDVQGPVSSRVADYVLSQEPRLVILGGPPTYIDKFTSHLNSARRNLLSIVSATPIVVVDHHLMRSPTWDIWLKPATEVAEEAGHQVLTMASLAGRREECLESQREHLYRVSPPSPEFMAWLQATDEYKTKHAPPI